MPAKASAPSRCSSTDTSSRPIAGLSGAARLTTATTRRRRSRSSCAPPAWCRRRAGELGPHVIELIGLLLDVNALHRLRSAQGVIGLADRYGIERLDAACARAIEVGDPSYRTVKRILVAGTEHADRPAVMAPIASAHLHGQAALFATIDDQKAAG